MRLPIFYIPKTRFKKFLIIEQKYKSDREIIPLGCDCHPAYTLQKLNIRKTSLPFDWLNCDPIKGLLFVHDNVETNFKYFLINLCRNSKGHIVSERYPFAEFIHEKNLIEKDADKLKFAKRISRFQQMVFKNTYYLYNITSHALDSESSVYSFYESVLQFDAILDSQHSLCIYIRYDESINENKIYCEMLIGLVNELKFVKIANYIRKLDQDGIWGDANYYPTLYSSLGIKIKMTYPKIYFK